MGESQSGAHICAFYDSKQDMLIAGGYFKAARAREYCLWAISESEHKRTAPRRCARASPVSTAFEGWHSEIVAGALVFRRRRVDLRLITGAGVRISIARWQGHAGCASASMPSGSTRTNHWSEFREYEH